jgi:hypothetical protein
MTPPALQHGSRRTVWLDFFVLCATCSGLARYRIFDSISGTIDVLLRFAFDLRQLAFTLHFLVAEELADFFLDLAGRVLDFPINFVCHTTPILRRRLLKQHPDLLRRLARRVRGNPLPPNGSTTCTSPSEVS